MAGYLGAKPAVNGIYTVDEFTSSGGTTYTLSRAPGTKNNIQVNAGGLAQYPSAYSVSGTTLTLSGVPSGQKVVVRHMGETILYPNLSENAVDSEHYTNGSIDEAHIAADAVNFVTHLKAGTDGELITWDASGNPAAVAVGTATHVLTSGGAGVAPTFQAPASSSFPIGASAHIGGSHQTVATGTYTKLNFNTELYDPNSNFNTTTYAYTVPSGQAGKYLVTAFAGVQTLGDGKRVSIAVYKNNSYMWTPYASASGSFSEYMSVAGVLDLAAADYLDVRGWHNKGSNADFSASAYDSVFSIQRIA